MPRKPIDYSQTVVYKICCKELTVKEVYVGSTTSIVKRRNSHKTTCTNEKCKQYNLYVYQFIREHGGFENWEVIVIEEYQCENDEQKRTRERHWYEELKAELNSCRPIVTVQESKEEKKEYGKEYRVDNAEKLKEDRAKYYIENVDKIKEDRAKYRIENPDKIKENNAKYRIENPDKIKEHNAQIITCICGSKHRLSGKARHLCSEKHINFMKLNTL